MKKENKMRDIRIAKIVLNIGCGTKLSLDGAKRILEAISGSKAVITKTKKRTTFNVPKKKPIGCKVTIRQNQEELLKRLLAAKENRLKRSNFDATGNVSFGIPEYIEIPGMEYDPKIGVLGLDVSVALERPGYRVGRKRMNARIGKKHKISTDDAANFLNKSFGVDITE